MNWELIFLPACWINKILDFFRSQGTHATGHKLVATEDHGKLVKLHSLKCDVCGAYQLGWEKV